MSGGDVVSTRGGIDVRIEDLRAAAQIMSDLVSTLWQHMTDLQAKATHLGSLAYSPNPVRAQLESGGLARTRGAAGEAVRMSRSLLAAADDYDTSESWIERTAANSIAVAKDATKLHVRTISGGRLDTPWDWDVRAVEPAAWLLGIAGLSSAAGGIAAVLDWRGQPVVRSTGVDASGAGSRPPRTVADLLTTVERLGGDGASDVGVQFLEFDDGRPRQVIVSLPGTSQWTPGSDVPSDVTAGPAAIAGLPTSYSSGVEEILEQSGVTALDTILIVGHSLGGMVAAQLAAQLSRSRKFTVANVVTAGAPIARIDIPDAVQVIALENKEDPVHYLDGRANEDSPNVLTITVDTGASGIDAHTIHDGYAPAADAVDRSETPQVQHALEGLAPYLEADRATTRTYSITRP